MQLSSASLPLSLIIQQYHHRLTTDHTRTVVNSYALLFIDIHSKLSFSRIGRGAVLSVDHNVILCYDVCGWTRKKHRFKNNTVLVRACVKQNIIALWAKYEENSSETTRNLAPVWDSRRRPAALESPWTTRKFVCSPSYLMVSTVRFSYVENDFLTRWPGGGGVYRPVESISNVSNNRGIKNKAEFLNDTAECAGGCRTVRNALSSLYRHSPTVK